MTSLERLHKFMARAGVASRRKCEELIASGRVKVNGQVVTCPGACINPGIDRVEINGHLLESPEEKIYILLYKPRGYVTTLDDPQGRRKVTDLLKDIPQRIYPAGRLDFDTEGLLLLTNDGELTYQLTHPRHQMPKTYLVWVNGIPSPEKLRLLAQGLLLEDGPTAPARVHLRRKLKGNALLEITIYEGRKRQVRRMCEHIGHPVYRLKRIAIGFLTLGDLKPGQYRFLEKEEVQKLKKEIWRN